MSETYEALCRNLEVYTQGYKMGILLMNSHKQKELLPQNSKHPEFVEGLLDGLRYGRDDNKTHVNDQLESVGTAAPQD